MKKFFSGVLLFSCALLSSCIQNEPLNSECDIEVASIANEEPERLVYSKTECTKEVPSADSVIVFRLPVNFTDNDLLKEVCIGFATTKGATITPENGSAQDFSDGKVVKYTVTSEDRQWHRNYYVQFISIEKEELYTDLSFENFELEESNNPKYYNWFEILDDGYIHHQWASGNPGYKISKSSAEISEYPTIPVTAEEFATVSGSAVKLETRETGAFGAMVNMRIAAGNLFIGTFDVSNALKDAMKATRFGKPFNKRPVRFEGYYQFVPGARFQDKKGKEVVGRVDEPDLYSVFYKNTDENGEAVILKGDDILTHPNIVALARLRNHETIQHGLGEWHYFSIPYDYLGDIDKNTLDTYGYNLTVVFTSSIEGATFCGAPGSTLYVDEVKVIWE